MNKKRFNTFLGCLGGGSFAVSRSIEDGDSIVTLTFATADSIKNLVKSGFSLHLQNGKLYIA